MIDSMLMQCWLPSSIESLPQNHFVIKGNDLGKLTERKRRDIFGSFGYIKMTERRQPPKLDKGESFQPSIQSAFRSSSSSSSSSSCFWRTSFAFACDDQ